MRDYSYAIATCAIVIMLCVVALVSVTQPDNAHQLKNAYHPFTVETSVRDR